MRMLKNILFALVSFLLVFLLLDYVLCRKILKFGFEYDSKEFYLQRYPRPYIEFTGKPNALDHNAMGYRGKTIKQAPDSSFKVVFFGGSTGYYGAPPIPQLLEEQLSRLLNRKVFVANCSVLSSNHNQHLHAMVEQIIGNHVDLVIFYGGFNENIQPTYYDPRPGYPFNYFYKHECPPWRMKLVKYSAILGDIERRYGVITGINWFRDDYAKDKVAWYHDITRNYFNTLEKARIVSTGILKSSNGQPCKFIGFYQPYIVPEIFKPYHREIIEHIRKTPYLFDISTCLDSVMKNENVFYDNIHVNQKANEIVATTIASRCVKYLQQ